MRDQPMHDHRARRPRMLVFVLVPVLAAGLALACGGKKEPKTLPAQTVSQVSPAIEPPPQPLPPPIRELPPPRRAPVTVIEGDDDDQPKTLLEASALAKALKGETPPPVVELTDENLSEYAEGGKVIIMEPTSGAPRPQDAPADPADDRVEADDVAGADAIVDDETSRDELYWRNRGLELRRGWRETLDTIDRLELEAASLRQRFYAEDDPYVRDAQVKPAWDRALDRLAELRQQAVRYQESLGDFLEAGRRNEIPAGWLNEGWEIEPTAEELREQEDIPVYRPIDAPIVDRPARDVSGGGRR